MSKRLSVRRQNELAANDDELPFIKVVVRKTTATLIEDELSASLCVNEPNAIPLEVESLGVDRESDDKSEENCTNTDSIVSESDLESPESNNDYLLGDQLREIAVTENLTLTAITKL